MIFNQNKLYKNVIGVIFGGKFLHVARLENGRITEIVNREINNRESKEVILNDIINTIKKYITIL